MATAASSIQPRGPHFHAGNGGPKVQNHSRTTARIALNQNSPTVTTKRSHALGAAGTALLGLLFWLTPLGQGLVDLSYDFPFAFRLDVYADEAVIVRLDEPSRRELQQPSVEGWNRQLHAQVLERLTAWKVKAIVLDLPLDQPTSHDAQFLRALTACRKVALAGFRPSSTNAGSKAIVLPLPALQRIAGWGLGQSEAAPEVVRRHELHDPAAPALAWRAAQLVQAMPPASAPPRWINYYGPPGSLPSFSYADVLRDRLPSEVFSNKVVFIGRMEITNTAAAGVPTPYTRWREAKSSSVEIDTTRFLNLLHGDWLTRLSAPMEFLFIVGLGALCGWSLGTFRPLAAAGVALVMFLVVTSLGIGMAWHQRVWFAWIILAVVQIPAALVWSALSNTWQLSAELRDLNQSLAGNEPPKPPAPPLHPPPAPAPAAITEGAQPGPPAVPNHQLIRCIGKGAYGEVWLARDDIGVFHAVKLVFRKTFPDRVPYEREYRGVLQYTSLSRTHHGLVQILDLGRDNAAGFFYYVMELADCEQFGRKIDPATYSPRHLARELDRRRLLPVAECVRLGVELAEAVGYLHSRQLVHRDIKTANIIFVNNLPKLADIGLVTHIAEAKRDDKKLGTEGFVPPEGPGTHAADVYSLGKVLCEACLGLAAATSHAPPEVPPDRSAEPCLSEFVAIIRKACEDDLALRYPSIHDMQNDLMRLQEQLPPGK